MMLKISAVLSKGTDRPKLSLLSTINHVKNDPRKVASCLIRISVFRACWQNYRRKRKMSGIRYLIDDLDCLESCNSIPMTHANAVGMAAIK